MGAGTTGGSHQSRVKHNLKEPVYGCPGLRIYNSPTSRILDKACVQLFHITSHIIPSSLL